MSPVYAAIFRLSNFICCLAYTSRPLRIDARRIHCSMPRIHPHLSHSSCDLTGLARRNDRCRSASAASFKAVPAQRTISHWTSLASKWPPDTPYSPCLATGSCFCSGSALPSIVLCPFDQTVHMYQAAGSEALSTEIKIRIICSSYRC